MPARFWLWMSPSGTSAACPWSLVRRCRASILTRHVSCGGICACGPDYHLDGEQAQVVVPKSLSKGQQWIRYVSLGSSAKSLRGRSCSSPALPIFSKSVSSSLFVLPGFIFPFVFPSNVQSLQSTGSSSLPPAPKLRASVGGCSLKHNDITINRHGEEDDTHSGLHNHRR